MNIQTPTPKISRSFKARDASQRAATVVDFVNHLSDVSNLRVAVVSDAISGRNGVGTFYQDLLAQIEPVVDEIALISPSRLPDHTLERFALPMPGDKTQRLAWPSRKEIQKRLDQVQPTLIVVPSLGPFTFFAVAYARKRQIPLVVVNHTDFDHILSIYWPKLIAKPLRMALDLVNRWLCKQAVAVGVMHDGAGEAAKRIGARNVRVMATPLSQSFLSKPIQPLEERATRAIFVGRLAKEKGIADLLTTARMSPNTHFTIVGDGPLREDVETAAESCENLTYRGWLPRSGVLEEVDSADVLILPSAYETFGTVALEALARERYVIASSGCGIAEWPALAKGIFVVPENGSLPKVLQDMQIMPAAERLQKARQSWDAVQDFNSQAVDEWLELFQDAARSYDR
ncbi:2-deoxystreptamine N-acetyl-D-glucosaminyltransferase [Cognatishimia activa]|uniref:2-deoxystreptamine N-acetyl-D-glucosaminyltransferase n=1 Tax=Cognatishimia activa TaxID=1715691 RepID=A0A0P1IPK4_9RHOB|nr:2-deoxystreptamine N-acetyl-D-glucosaminyltransferase [Cognatishimia activa]CUK25473.1 2-deoxystreptamine N-acetyl-D-glucosaminyltransferase [Cognatishimia activa]